MTHLNGTLLKSSSYYADNLNKSSSYSSTTDKDYEDPHQQLRRHPPPCDTSDYLGSGLDLNKSSMTTGLNYYSSSPNLNGLIGNIHVVRAKTEELSSYDAHQLSLKPTALDSQNIVLLGGAGEGGGSNGTSNEDLSMNANDSNNNINHSEPFLSLVPPPPHVAAELGRRCLAFNNEQVSEAII